MISIKCSIVKSTEYLGKLHHSKDKVDLYKKKKLVFKKRSQQQLVCKHFRFQKY